MRELLVATEASYMEQKVLNGAHQLLRNTQDLAWLIHTYDKPMIALLHGAGDGSGGALPLLANRGGAYYHSAVRFDPCRYGYVPTGGVTYLLSRLEHGIGAFMLFTGAILQGADILFSGLAKHWISPDAFPFLELTGEKQLALSEKDAVSLLDEHFLNPSDSAWDISWLHENLHNIAMTFGNAQSVSSVVASLDKKTPWGKLMMQRISERSTLAIDLSLAMLRATQQRRAELYAKGGFDVTDVEKMWNLEREGSGYVDDLSLLRVHEEIEKEVMALSLKLENRVALKLMTTQDLLRGLRWDMTKCKKETPPSDTFTTTSSAEYVEEFLWKRLPDYTHEWEAKYNRNTTSLSSHPRLRELHPDYDMSSKLDHDPLTLAVETKQFHEHANVESMWYLEKLITGDNPTSINRRNEAALAKSQEESSA